jgi:hypothetical protein
MAQQEPNGKLPSQYTLSLEFAKRIRTILINAVNEDEAMFLRDRIVRQGNDACVFIEQHIAWHLKEFLHGETE